MKTFRVHFSFYDEENGQFDESYYSVSAENVFEARRTAWLLRDTDDNTRFHSCVKQCGATWDASPLDMADYFNAQAAYDKYHLRKVENVDIPNAALKKDLDAAKRAESERSYFIGCIDSISFIAKDIGKPFGMEPPHIYEEIEYTWRLVSKLDEIGRHDAAEALAQKIDKAKKWDNGAIHDLRQLFIHDSIHHPGDYINFAQFFGRDGVFPERADVKEREYKYITRWTEARRDVNTLSRLPMFGERDVIKNSVEAMPYDYKVLVLRQDALTPDYRKPENILWTPRYDVDGVCLNLENNHPETRFNVENMITGVVVALCRKDFLGVLRPEYADKIDFEALKSEYVKQHAEVEHDENNRFDGFGMTDEDEDSDEWEDEI